MKMFRSAGRQSAFALRQAAFSTLLTEACRERGADKAFKLKEEAGWPYAVEGSQAASDRGREPAPEASGSGPPAAPGYADERSAGDVLKNCLDLTGDIADAAIPHE